MPTDRIDHFRIEWSPDNQNWNLLVDPVPAPTDPSLPCFLPGSPTPGDARCYRHTNAPEALTYYRMWGYTQNGIQFTYNQVSAQGNPQQPPGQCLLQRQFGGVGSPSQNQPTMNRIRVDHSGNVVCCGNILGTINLGGGANLVSSGGPDCFVAKWTPQGQLIKAIQWGIASTQVCESLVIDSQNNIILSGSVYAGPNPQDDVDFGFGPVHTFGGGDIFLLKLDSNLNPIFFKVWGGTGTDNGIGVGGVGVDAADNIYMAGFYGQFGTAPDFGGGPLFNGAGKKCVFVSKFSPSGNYSWAFGYGGTDDATSRDLVVDSSGVYIIGTFRGTCNFGTGNISTVDASNVDGFAAKYSPTTGAPQWVKHFTEVAAVPPKSNSLQDMGGVALDSAGNLIVAMGFERSMRVVGTSISMESNAGLSISKWQNNGSLIWEKHFLSDGILPRMQRVACDNASNIIFIGIILQPVDFGFGYNFGNGGEDVMLVKLNAGGISQWAFRGGPQGDFGKDVTINSANNQIFITGESGTLFGLNLGAQQVITTPNTTNSAFWAIFTP